jgi:DNA-binding NtrC family response regulator
MSDKLDVIIVDDQVDVCEAMAEIVRQFYSWGEVISFTRPAEALKYLRSRSFGVAVFVVDVFLGDRTAFDFLDVIADKYPMAHEDAVIVTGNASDDVVNMCVASNITHLVEKPIQPFSLQMAVRAVVSKYVRFARRLREDPALAEGISSL